MIDTYSLYKKEDIVWAKLNNESGEFVKIEHLEHFEQAYKRQHERIKELEAQLGMSNVNNFSPNHKIVNSMSITDKRKRGLLHSIIKWAFPDYYKG